MLELEDIIQISKEKKEGNVHKLMGYLGLMKGNVQMNYALKKSFHHNEGISNVRSVGDRQLAAVTIN